MMQQTSAHVYPKRSIKRYSLKLFKLSKSPLILFGLTLLSLLITLTPAFAQDTASDGGFSLQVLLESILQWISDLGPAGPIALIVVYVVATVAFISGGLLTLGAGALFGVVQGSLYAFLGASLGATAAFLVGRYLARGWVAKKIAGNQNFAAIDRAVGREGLKIVFLTRLSPVFPFVLLNYAFGITGVSLRDYVVGFIGMIPGTILYTYLGSTVTNLAALFVQTEDQGKSPAELALFIVGLVATFGVTIFVTRLARKALNEEVGMDEPSVNDSVPSTPVTYNPDETVTMPPMDEHNQKLVNHVHPPNWPNPTPAETYDLVVIGAGTAGLVVAAGAAGLDVGLKVALIERNLMGGDCLNVGCVPSKCMIRSSRVVADIRNAAPFGITPPDHIDINFAEVMERMRRLRAGISHHDSAERFKNIGVDIFLGQGTFRDQNQIEVGGKVLSYKKAVIATGARAVRPAIDGIDDVGYLTNETVFSLTEAPKRLAVIGGGPIGCELAQTFQRLGSQVVLFHRGDHLLNKEDADAAEIVQQTFINEGIQLVLGCKLERVKKTDEGKELFFIDSQGQQTSLVVDEILAGAGRAPNVEGLNLEAVGVQFDYRRGVKVNDHLQTTNPNIYAAGDICMDWKFTHAADAAARIVIKNTLFSPFGFGRYKLSDVVMPWATYTDPEIAHVGIYEHDADAKGIPIETIKIPFSGVDRAIADGEEDGFVKIHYKPGSDEILGATIVARHAGDMISEVTTAIVHKIGLSKLSSVIHPYPTQAEGIKKAADAYRRTLLTPNTKKFLALLTKLS